MSKHTVKIKKYKGEGGGREIISRLILDDITLSLLTEKNCGVVVGGLTADVVAAIGKIIDGTDDEEEAEDD